MNQLAVVHSRAVVGIDAPAVTVEVHLYRGLPSLSIVGMPETAVKESKDRVRSAIINNHFEFPLSRITVNLAPADLPKEGGRYDLAIAIGILAASGQLPTDPLSGYEFIGELSLSGQLKPVSGVLPCAIQVAKSSRQLFLPAANAAEARLVDNVLIVAAEHLIDVAKHLCGQDKLDVYTDLNKQTRTMHYADFNDVCGQQQAKRALEIAAAGGHGAIMIGPPGSGKTMLAERMPGILPLMSESQALETAAVYSISQNGFDIGQWQQRPVRSPHHTASAAALVGGGSQPRPGEISLAHNGILFLDELPEFTRHVLEVLREPMESGSICISRAARQVRFPAAFQFIAAMNPCPCGYYGDANQQRCQCSEDQVRRYRQRLSGPLLDRIDLHVEVPNITTELLQQDQQLNTESSTTICQRVTDAHNRQLSRTGKNNSRMNRQEVELHCHIDGETRKLLQRAIEKLGLSARGLHRILKVARTIADLQKQDEISRDHVQEAISYRRLDRSFQ